MSRIFNLTAYVAFFAVTLVAVLLWKLPGSSSPSLVGTKVTLFTGQPAIILETKEGAYFVALPTSSGIVTQWISPLLIQK